MATTSQMVVLQAIHGPKKNAAFTLRLPFVAQVIPLFQLNPTIAAGDIQVSIDGGAFANLATLPSEVPANGKIVEVALTAGEMNGDVIVVRGIDQAGDEWADWEITLYTRTVTVDELVRSTTPANTLAVDAGGKVGASSLAANTITAASIQNDAITAAKIATDAIDSDALAASALAEIQAVILTDATPFPGARIDAAITTRADAASYTPTRAAKLDNLDAAISTRQRASKVGAAVNDLSASPTAFITNLTESFTDFWKGQVLVFTTGALAGQATKIVAYDGTTFTLTVQPLAAAPANGVLFDILPSSVDTRFGFLDVGVSSRADGTFYTPTRAAKIDNLDAAITTRADATFYTNARAALLDNLTRLDVNVSTRADGAAYTNGRAAALDNLVFLDAAISSRANGTFYTAGRAAALDNLDAAITTRAAASAWTTARAAKIDFLDVAISTRADAASYTPTRAAKLDNLDVAVSSRAVPGGSVTLAAGSIDAAQITAAAANKLADHKARRHYSSTRLSSDGDSLTFRSELGAIAKQVNDLGVVGSQLKIRDDLGADFGTQNITASPGAAPVVALATV